MGFFDRFSRHPQQPPPDASPPEFEPRVDVEITFSSASVAGLVKLTGTTTFSRDAVTQMLDRRNAPDHGLLIVQAALHREPENRADPRAVAVHVEGDRVAYLPGFAAPLVDLSLHASKLISVQFFFARQADGTRRTQGWAWLSDGEPQWEYSESNPPPLTAAERRHAHAASTDAMIADAAANGGPRADQFRAGAVNGIHYLQTVEPIQQLKREGRLEEALALCFIAIEGAENAREGREPAPWYTEQAAIILRKLGRRDEEVAVLRRWLAAAPTELSVHSAVAERLAKLLLKGDA